ncbi:hypothetical protein F2Q69_00010925 [Brassica cretica]|uniref:RNA-binding S4 domain-containing protein n=1 Tax=Brassica cretica TaxID=69181 RepID=A0A8S9QKL7_BRACR|nr:hypothetical protein F2Q69_00010925 [Brassica cretica]
MPIEFDISFAPPKPTPSSPRGNTAFQQLFIPWIVRGEDGKLKVQSQPPAHLIHALADATTQNPKKKVKKKKPQASSSSSAVTSSSTSEPKLSKAARRYYNENIKEPPQRLSKPIEFDISFAPPKPTPSSPRGNTAFQQLFIPWIVRGEDGKLKVQSQPPAHLIHALADATTQNPKKKVKKKKPQASSSSSAVTSSSTSEPKLSKAARRYYNENIKEPPQRLSKVLAAAGVASRRTSEELIFDGKVTVNGSLCTTPQTRVDPTRDIIYVNGNRVPKKLPPKVYFALNKPKGYICSSGEKETKSVVSLFDEFMASWDKRNPGTPKPRLFTVGRLDVATTGLIIVTNDGDFAQKLSHPSSSLPKE